MSKLITPSLVSAVRWCQEAPNSHINHDPLMPTWREKAPQDLRNMLARDYTEPPGPALLLGIKFEDAVYKECKAPTGKGTPLFQEFVAECVGGQFQRITKVVVEIDGVEYCCYGKIDAYFPTIIKDLKTTSKEHVDPEGYLKSFQHEMYCLNEHIDDFRYCIAVFDANQKIVDKVNVDWHCDDREALKAKAISIIRETIAYIKVSDELFELYNTKFSRY